MRPLLLVAIVATTALAAPKKPTKPAPVAKTTTAEVCPAFNTVTIVPFWEFEEVWPSCPIASPVLSIGGRCLDGTQTCMQPCSAKRVDAKGKKIESQTFSYEGGRLVAAKNTSYFGDKSMDTHYTCERDSAGRRTKCKGYSEMSFVYKSGTFAGTVSTKDGKTSSKTVVVRDPKNPERITGTAWEDDRGGVSFKYTYNADGTMVSAASDEPRMSVKQTWTYDGGRRVKQQTVPSGAGFKPTDVVYRYDKAGRVTKETSSGQVNEVVDYSYDKTGRLVKQVRDIGTNKFTLTYQYSCK